MKVSYNWLQDFFIDKLPEPEKLADLLNMHVFEVESVVKSDNDTVLDVKVLPDRAHYALSHFGVAYEISAITGISLKDERNLDIKVGSGAVKVSVLEKEVCSRYIARVVDGVSGGKVNDDIKKRLEAVGQRSINPIVDIANYTMFDLTQPLHAFDADKIKGEIKVRFAKSGEKITTLDNKVVLLDESVLIISDEEGPLAIAGIKGGKKAEVDSNTKRVILESATFDPVLIRKTSNKLGIKTDASKRFENNLPTQSAYFGILYFSKRLQEVYGENASFGELVDINSSSMSQGEISISLDFIIKKLGINIPEKEILEILGRLFLKTVKDGNSLKISIPSWRKDLVIPEDVVEEIGRLYGYEKIKPVLPETLKSEVRINKNFYYINKIRKILSDNGFSEVYTSTFGEKGDLEVLYPVASDKNFLRTELSKSIEDVLRFNIVNADLLGLKQVKIFEVGKIFKKGFETNSLCVGIANTKGVKEKVNDLIRNIREILLNELKVDISTVCTVDDSGGIMMIGQKQIGVINAIDGILELNVDEIIKILPDPESFDVKLKDSEVVNYKPFSKYPFIVRDIAVFVPTEVSKGDLLEIIKKGIGESKNLLVNHYLFDEFKKGDKVSYAFRLVFQSFDKTLTDDEVNKVMDGVNSVILEKGWVVR